MNKINVDKIMNVLETQFESIMSMDKEYYKKYSIVLSNEQTYVNDETRTPNTIYIVVKLLPGSLNFEQVLLPFSFTAISEQNHISVCQRLLYEYVQTFNLADPQDKNGGEDSKNISKQMYELPSVVANFEEINDGFRSCFTVSGRFLISFNSNPTYIYMGEKDENTGKIVYDKTPLKVLSFGKSFDNQLDPQPFYGTHNFTKSVAKVGSLTITFTMYLTDNDLCNKILAIEYRKNGATNNDDFYFLLKNSDHNYSFNNGTSAPLSYEGVFKLVNCSDQNNIGELPLISVTFAN